MVNGGNESKEEGETGRGRGRERRKGEKDRAN